MLHGAQRNVFDLSFAVPAECADQLKSGRADIGIVPIAAFLDQQLEVFRGAGIACRGPVRSILLISKLPFRDISVLATDCSSRSSVMLSRILLSRRFGTTPALVSLPPQVEPMLEMADAALIIGDPALVLDPERLRADGYYVADLGAEWVEMTDLPMVFAVWAGHASVHSAAREQAFLDSCRFGLEHIEDIVDAEHARRGVSPDLVRTYLTEHIAFELGEREYRGMERFLEYAAEMGPPVFLEPSTSARILV